MAIPKYLIAIFGGVVSGAEAAHSFIGIIIFTNPPIRK